MQLVADFCAAFCWCFALIEVLQDKVDGKSPEEEASSCTARDEESRNKEKEGNANSEGSVDKGAGHGHKQRCRNGNEQS